MHHSVDICFDIAHKLRDPQNIFRFMQEQAKIGLFSDKWPEFSLVLGIPGIVCFYAIMNLNFENEGWDRVAHDYLLCTQNYLETIDYINPSLFYGLAGLSFSIYLCSENGKRYSKLLSRIDDMFIHGVQGSFLKQMDHYLDPDVLVPPHYYNLADGLSGIIAYLIHRDDLREVTIQCVDCLVKVLSNHKNHDSSCVFPWFVSSRTDGYDEFYKNGFYRLEVPYGISGVIGALSQAGRKGLRINGLHELLINLSEWIRSKQVIRDNRMNWNRKVIHDRDSRADEGVESFENSWFMGAPAISKCLYMASRAIKNQELAKYSEKIFLSHFQHLDQHETDDTSFVYGKAGLLSLAYQMGCETESPLFFKIAKRIELDLKLCYSPLHAFGFRSIDFSNESPEWIDNPFLYSGACGICLSLLQLQGRVSTPQIFLI